VKSLWLRFLFRRLFVGLLACIFLVLITFLLVHLIPGDPIRRIAGLAATPEYVARLREQLGLDRDLLTQFWIYVQHVSYWDLGLSIQTGEGVATIIAQRLPYTLLLISVGVLIATVLGVVLGFLAAWVGFHSRLPLVDSVLRSLLGAAGAIPEIVYGTIAIVLLAVRWQFFPVAGMSGWESLVLPSLAIGIRPAFTIARIVRVESIQILGSRFIQTARSKRVSTLRVYLVHTLPNIATAVLTLSGLLFGYLLGAVVVIEVLFMWPGIGSAAVTAVINLDYPVIQGVVLILGVLVLVVNLLIDTVLAMIDKRRLLAQ